MTAEDDGAVTANAARERSATVVVVGGGQAGLSAAHHLQRRGFASALTEPDRVAREFKRRIGDPTPIPLGEHAFTVQATDDSGNTESKTVFYEVVDTKDPQPAGLVSPPMSAFVDAVRALADRAEAPPAHAP